MNIRSADFIAGATSLSDLPAPAFSEIAFAGRSNVGKSSLINSLVARKGLVRTSSTPGCTRAINIFRVSFTDDAVLDLVDLPGYGYAKRSKQERKSWGPMIETFLTGRPGLRGVVVIVDARHGLQDTDTQLLEFLDAINLEVIVVATKTDKLPTSKRKLALKDVQKQADARVFGYSAVTNDGRERLWKYLLKLGAIEVR